MEAATCERIIKSVDGIIRKDNELDEFDVIHSLGEINKSPVIHINHKLALESWCIKYVYKYAYTSVLHYHNTGGYEYSESIIYWTQFCLLIMPEVMTFWNIRKKMIKKSLLKVDTDLLLSKLVLTKKPKCIEAFQHRRWLFTLILQNHSDATNAQDDLALNDNFRISMNIREFFWSELDLCSWTANRKANNYHSWNHRLWILKHLSSMGNIENLYKAEYDWSQYWVSLHVSEHSGMHYRCQVLDAISKIQERGNINLSRLNPMFESLTDLYTGELKLNEDLMQMYQDHEALFYQRRVILLKLQGLFGNNTQRHSSPPPAFKRSCIETLNAEWSAVVRREVEMAKRAKYCSDHHLQLSQQHLNWLNNMGTY